MTKKQAIVIVLEELLRRLPENSREGFLANEEVYEAIELLNK